MLTHKNTSPVKPTRVLILGTGGFLAPEIARVMEEDHIEVWSKGSKDIDLTAAGARDALADEIRPADVVVMVAGLTPVRR